MAVKTRVNQQITAPQLRVIDETGANLGVLSREQAIKEALARGLDLIEIAPTARPPVAKIMDFGKYQYLENKKLKSSKAKNTKSETKSLQIKIGTSEHDLMIKANKTSEFLRKGHRVKIELFLPGRSKYLAEDFLRDRLERILKLISEPFKVAVPAAKSPKGLATTIERPR